jgi:peptide/nickel transport system ATP-binding protein
MPVLEDEDNPVKQWDITYQQGDFYFQYHLGTPDEDWVEVQPNHFVACTLKEVSESTLQEVTA